VEFVLLPWKQMLFSRSVTGSKRSIVYFRRIRFYVLYFVFYVHCETENLSTTAGHVTIIMAISYVSSASR
ncbi:hypothetical protein L9F63_024194, partial [Diploptera punctata]